MIKTFFKHSLISLSLFITFLIHAQGNNEKIVRATGQEDLKALMNQYHEEAVLMPEYHAALYGKKDIKQYYQQRFGHSDVRDYKRTIHSYEQSGDYVTELGTFSYQYTVAGKAPVTYTGKYLVVWKADRHQKLKILAEIWGSDTYIDRSALSFPADNNPAPVKPKPLTPKLEHELKVREKNQFIEQCVKKRDGDALATAYDEHAIYMPYYSPMLEGHEKIKAYYIQHEDKNVVIDSVSIQMSRVFTTPDKLIVLGFYTVAWRAGENSGTVNGKSINIWRKTKTGDFMLHRQMVNHD